MTKVNRERALVLAKLAGDLDLVSLRQELLKISGNDCQLKRHTWQGEAQILNNWLKDIKQPAPYTIFVKGNGKLPFYNFSTLPLVTCPGKGECATYCYSLKAWRYPGSLCRQIQNTILILTQSVQLKNAWHNLPQGINFRLYVDGDFDSTKTVDYWFKLCAQRKDINVYGYSKSWQELLDFKGNYPKNYTLNLSSGHKHNADTEKKVKTLSITRGEFITLPVEKSVVGKYDTPKYKQNLKKSAQAAGIKKYFACPGKCGTCTKKVHACGSTRFDKIPILIGIH
mgnify:FL=1